VSCSFGQPFIVAQYPLGHTEQKVTWP